MSQNNKQNNVEKLEELLEFKPDSLSPLTKTILQKIKDDVRQKREQEAEARARKLIETALELHAQAKKLDKEYRENMNKINENLGKILKSLSVKEESPLAEPEAPAPLDTLPEA